MSSDVDFEMTRNITSVQWSNKDLAILDKANPLRNILPYRYSDIRGQSPDSEGGDRFLGGF